MSGRGRWSSTITGVLAVATVVALLPTAPAEATDVHVRERERLLGDVTTERLEIRLSDGALARGNLITVPDDDPDAVVRSRIAQGTVAGTQAMVPLSRAQLSAGGIAGINGGYFLNGSTQQGPWGAPNGLHVDRGRLLAGQAVNSLAGGARPTGRGMVGWRDDGGTVMDRIEVTHELEFVGGTLPPARIDELNRQPWPEDQAHRRPDGELLAYNDQFGTAVRAPAGSRIVTVDGFSLHSTGRTEGVVTAASTVSSDTTVAVPAGRHLLVAHGERARDLQWATEGGTLAVRTTIAPEATDPGRWDDLDSGVAGGQLLIRDGQRRPASEWTDFAAFDWGHAHGRHPRTAIGRTGDGRTLLVTVDGRRTGWSVGLTVGELADTMVALGARDAVNLDGGGSTTMTIEGAVHNRPSVTGRSVADGVFVYVPRPNPARSLAEACPAEVLQTTFVDVSGTTHAESIGCLAGWGITTGVTQTTYEPHLDVTRAQMASFIARWIDDVAERGSGVQLPAEADLVFTDVSPNSAHAGPIARLTQAGVITGRTATTYEPFAPVSRAQTAALIARAVGYATGQALPDGRDTFSDDNGSTHEADIDRLAAVGVVTGTGGWSYTPAAPVTRGAMASFVMRASALLVEDGVAEVPPEPIIVAGSDGADEESDLQLAEEGDVDGADQLDGADAEDGVDDTDDGAEDAGADRVGDDAEGGEDDAGDDGDPGGDG